MDEGETLLDGQRAIRMQIRSRCTCENEQLPSRTEMVDCRRKKRERVAWENINIEKGNLLFSRINHTTRQSYG